MLQPVVQLIILVPLVDRNFYLQKLCTFKKYLHVYSNDLLESKQPVAPSFDQGLVDQTVPAGSEVTLKCKVAGEPDPQVVWLKDGKKLKTTRQIKLTFADDNWCYLTIHSCESTDSGVYICTATNNVGAQSSQCKLTVTGM